MPEAKFVRPYGGDCHRALTGTSDGMPVAEVGATADEEIYRNCMSAPELRLEAKFAEAVTEVVGTLPEAGLADSAKKLTGDMRAMGGDGEIALQEASEFRPVRGTPMNSG